KAPATELATSLRALTQLALAHPVVALRVTNNGRAALTAPAAKDLRERAGAVWSWEVAGRLLAVDHAAHGVAIDGLASPPDLTRGGREELVMIVNGRPVRDPALTQAMLDAYRPLLPRDRFPMVVLTLALPETDVDVNVHPTKAWVRFRHPRLIAETVAAALQQALRRPAVVPGVPIEGREAQAPATGPASFAVEEFGGGAIVLRAVPALLRGDEPKRLIEAAVDEFAGPKAGEPAVDRALAFVACRAAVKANTPLAREEMERLVTELGTAATP